MFRPFKLIVFVLGLIATFTSAQAIQPVSGSYQKHYSSKKDNNHWLILGAIERIKGAVSPESHIRIRGKVTKWLWQMPVGTSHKEAFSQLHGQVVKNTVTLFDCEGRSCGPSNDFANQVFEQSILYGRDSLQYYWVGLQEQVKGKATVWVLYTTTRSNKRVYAYLEKIVLADGEQAKFVGQLAQNNTNLLLKRGYIILDDMATDSLFSQDQLVWLKSILQSNPKMRFAVVVHTEADGETDALLEKSQQKAQALVDQVAAAHGFVKNLYPHGAGAMLPRDGVSGDRVEVVRVSR